MKNLSSEARAIIEKDQRADIAVREARLKAVEAGIDPELYPDYLRARIEKAKVELERNAQIAKETPPRQEPNIKEEPDTLPPVNGRYSRDADRLYAIAYNIMKHHEGPDAYNLVMLKAKRILRQKKEREAIQRQMASNNNTYAGEDI